MCNNSSGGGGGGGGGGGATRKGPWTEQEDAQLVWFVRLLGERRWDFLAQVSGLRRTGKSCRLRWVNYLQPGLKRGRITADEERLILHLHAQWGSRWSRIARKLPGRTDNEIKNYWRTHMRKKAQEEKLVTIKKKNTTLVASPSSSSSSSYDDDIDGSATTTSSSASASASASVATSCTEALQETTSGRDEEAEEEETATTAASEQQLEMDRLWDEIAAAESYTEMSWGGGRGHVAVDATVEPSSPVWEFCTDYSLWRIDDEEYYNRMEHTHSMN